eukprot:gb/GECG01007852.1/.p1 GENE.gb/GECG01007852.1/~~gb/GECG01007852.1/.p1  ORF type:complete len:924 (+),score=108.99 gb/GECG01007852.1/:1-2772(+)
METSTTPSREGYMPPIPVLPSSSTTFPPAVDRARPLMGRYFLFRDHYHQRTYYPHYDDDDEKEGKKAAYEEEDSDADEEEGEGEEEEDEKEADYHRPSVWLANAWNHVRVSKKPKTPANVKKWSKTSGCRTHTEEVSTTSQSIQKSTSHQSNTQERKEEIIRRRRKQRKRKRRRDDRCGWATICSGTALRLNCIALLAAAVNLGWAVGETLLLPFLLRLGVHSSLAALVWAINPIFGIVLQGLVGVFTDQTGRLKTLAVCFSITACMGLLLVAYAPAILDSFYSSNVAPLPILTAVMFIAFGIADLSHDLILTPGRCLVGKHAAAEGSRWIPRGNAVWSTMSNAGRVLGLTVSVLPLNELPGVSAVANSRIQAVFVFTVIVNVILTVVSLVTATKGKRQTRIEEQGEQETYSPSIGYESGKEPECDVPGDSGYFPAMYAALKNDNGYQQEDTYESHTQLTLDNDTVCPDADTYIKFSESNNVSDGLEECIRRHDVTTAVQTEDAYVMLSEPTADELDDFEASRPAENERTFSHEQNDGEHSTDSFQGSAGNSPKSKGSGEVASPTPSYIPSTLEVPLIEETVTFPESVASLDKLEEASGNNAKDAVLSLPVETLPTHERGNSSGWTWTDVFHDLRLLVFMPKEIRTVFLLQCGGWFLFNLECFYLTSWVALRVFDGENCHPTRPSNECDDNQFEDGVQWGIYCLILQAVLAISFAPCIPKLNKWYGTAKVYFLTELLLGAVVCMFILPFVQTKVGVLIISIPLGLGPAVHLQNPFVLVDYRSRKEGKRATYTAILTTAMVASQLALSAFASSILGLYHRFGITSSEPSAIARGNGIGLTIVLVTAGVLVVVLDLALMKRFFRDAASLAPPVVREDDSSVTATPLDQNLLYDSDTQDVSSSTIQQDSLIEASNAPFAAEDTSRV